MSLKAAALASYGGQGWAALMGLAFIPLYVKVLGFETYGLIGAFAVMQAWVSLFDFGLTPTITREMARFREGARPAEFIRDLVRSLEAVYALVASLCVAAVWLGAERIATDWLRLQQLDPALVIASLHLMAFVLATRWLEQVYRGALQGLQDQVWLNVVQAVLATLRWGGAYVVIRFVSPSILLFFAWQGAVSLLTILLLVLRTYRLLPRIERPARFDRSTLRQVVRFAGAMFVGTFLSLLLTQGDKLIISRLLPLAEFGAYMLAATAAMGLLQLTQPINSVLFPHLTRLVASGDNEAIVLAYHQSCEWLAAIIVPPAIVLSMFASPVLFLWTGDQALAARVAPLLSILVLGTLCNGLMLVPYLVQLAYGWTSLSIRINVVAVLLLGPAVVWAVPRFGAIGAAWAWLALNLSYVVLTSHLMHRKVLPGERSRWYAQSVIRPVGMVALATAVVALMIPSSGSRVQAGLAVAAGLAIAIVAAAVALPRVRRVAVHAIFRPSPRLG